nr:hypothetical protein [Salinarimonas ramus]
MSLEIGGHERRDPVEPKGDGNRHAQEPFDLGVAALPFGLGGFNGFEHPSCGIEEALAVFGKAMTSGGPVQEPRAEPRLEALDRLAGEGLAHAERVGRGAEAAGRDHRLEHAHLNQPVVSHRFDPEEGRSPSQRQ